VHHAGVKPVKLRSRSQVRLIWSSEVISRADLGSALRKIETRRPRWQPSRRLNKPVE
jgi:hypothetical protein